MNLLESEIIEYTNEENTLITGILISKFKKKDLFIVVKSFKTDKIEMVWEKWYVKSYGVIDEEEFKEKYPEKLI